MNRLAEYRQSGIDPPIEVLLASEDWRPLVRFVEGWYRVPPSGTTGIDVSILNECERGMMRRMPAALREWYRLVGAHEAARDETAQDGETPLGRIGESPRWLAIFGENQDGWHCGILNEFCGLPNPPVHFQSFCFDPTQDAGYAPTDLVDNVFIRVSETLTDFVFTMAVRQLVIRLDASPFLRPGVCGACFGAGCNLDRIRREFSLRRLVDFPAGFSPEYDGSDLAIADGWGFAAKTAEQYEAMARAVAANGGLLEKPWRVD